MPEKYYESPRWTAEYLDCSMPVTFDTYNKCSGNCLYCFSVFWKSNLMGENQDKGIVNYRKTGVRFVNIANIKSLFSGRESTFSNYIKERKVMQWGGLADQFDMSEYSMGKTLELMKFFDEIDYPLSYSTKFTWWTLDKRYMNLFAKHTHNWHIKFSIINYDKKRSALMENGIPTPEERLRAMGRLSKLGIITTLRLRPFIIGFSNKDNEHIKLIERAGQEGAYSLSTEFMCIEGRADDKLKYRYSKISKVVGYNVYEFYKKMSVAAGYYRLNYEIKEKYIAEMKRACDKAGMKIYVSDAHHKEKCANGSCCGLPPEMNYSRGQFTEALVIAREKGEVRFSDIMKDAEHLLSVLYTNTGASRGMNAVTRCKNLGLSLYQVMRNIWNTPNDFHSPYKHYSGVVIPNGVDSNGDIIYKFNKKKYEDSLNK